MTRLLGDEDLLTEREVAREPAKRWRNRWLVVRPFRARSTGVTKLPGETYWGSRVWPSYETAEASANGGTGKNYCADAGPHSEWLGAFPIEGEGQ